MTSILNRWLPGFTLVAWGGVLLFSFAAGRLTLLHPSFRPFAVAAGIILVALAFVILRDPASSAACDGDCSPQPMNRLTIGRLLTFLVLILPILAAVVASPSGFSAATMRNRGFATEAAALPPAARDSAPEDFIPKNADGNYALEVPDLLFAVEDEIMRDTFENKTVEVVGQLLPETTRDVTGNRFRLVRMFMNCCAADARPIALTVEGRNRSDAEEMTWVKVIGRATFPIEEGKRVSVLEAEKIMPTDPPEEAMLF